MISKIIITGQWCNYTYLPVNKRDNGMKFLKAIRKVQLTRAKSEEMINKRDGYRNVKAFANPQNVGLKIEIIH